MDVKYLPQMQDQRRRSYLFVAIDRATRWVFVQIKRDKRAASVQAFLRALHKACPLRISKLLADHGKELTDRLFASREREPSGKHEFDRLCQTLQIEHRLTKPRTPKTNGMVERFNGRIADVLKTLRSNSAQDLQQTLVRYVALYNHPLPQSALKSRTPIQSIKDWGICHIPICFSSGHMIGRDEAASQVNAQAGSLYGKEARQTCAHHTMHIGFRVVQCPGTSRYHDCHDQEEKDERMVTKALETVVVGETDNSGPRSLMRVLRTFSLLSHNSDGMTLSALTAALETPKSSLLNLLRPLIADHYLVNEGGRYRLGPSVFRMSAGVLSAWNFAKTVRPFMEELSQRTGETVLLGVLNPEAGVLTYIEVIDSPHPIRYQIAAGTTRPLYASSTGRLLLAFSDADWVDEYLKMLVIKSATAQPLSKTWLRKQVTAIHERGFEYSLDQYLVGLASVAAPLYDGEGRCIAALSIAGPSDRFRAVLDKLVITVKEVASRASGVVAATEVHLGNEVARA